MKRSIMIWHHEVTVMPLPVEAKDGVKYYFGGALPPPESEPFDTPWQLVGSHVAGRGNDGDLVLIAVWRSGEYAAVDIGEPAAADWSEPANDAPLPAAAAPREPVEDTTSPRGTRTAIDDAPSRESVASDLDGDADGYDLDEAAP